VWPTSVGLSVGLLLTSTNSIAGGYVGLGTGIVYASNERFDETSILLDYDLGFRVGALTLGYGFQSGLRTEIEAAYRRNELEIIEFDDDRGIVNTGLHDAVDTQSLMVNLIYDFEWGIPVRPYVGIGVGAARIGYEISDTFSGATLLDESKTAFAYQGIVGVRAPLGRRFHVSADYRYWRNLEIDMTMEAGDPVSTDHPVHVASLTLSYDFNAPPRQVEKPPATPLSSGVYTQARLGWIAAEDSDIEDGLRDTNFDAFDVGSGVSVAAGYAWGFDSGRRVRAELELAYWSNEADVIDFGKAPGEFRLGGSVDTLAVSGNLIYDFASMAALRPYAGIGVGYAKVDYDVTLHDEDGESQYVNDADSGYAVQAMLGVNTRLSSRFEASLNYHYWWAPSIELENPDGVPLKTEHSAHGLMLGLRYLWGN
jgi:opacity protein-like surface antigen